VIFKVGKDSKEIHGHKLLLETASDYFMGHFSHEWKDKDEIILEDDDYHVILSIFSFIYTGSTRLNMNNLFDVLKVTHRFMLNELIESFVSEETFKEHGLHFKSCQGRFGFGL